MIITIYYSTLYMVKSKGVYCMIKSDSKVLPKADKVNEEKTAEPIVKADFSAKAV